MFYISKPSERTEGKYYKINILKKTTKKTPEFVNTMSVSHIQASVCVSLRHGERNRH